MLLSEVDDHRAQIHGITTLAENDLSSFATSILNEPPERVAMQLRAAAPAVISTYGEVAAVSGALFYETNRPKPGFTADLVGASIGDELTGALGWAFAPLFRPDDFELGPAEAVNRLAGLTQMYVADADRNTIIGASKRDHLSTGVQRYARPSACSFCALMTVQTQRAHRWHNSCKCLEVPGWEEAPPPSSDVMDRYAESAHGAIAHLDKLRAEHPDFLTMKRRQFLVAHPELAMKNKNITRVMRELYGFEH